MPLILTGTNLKYSFVQALVILSYASWFVHGPHPPCVLAYLQVQSVLRRHWNQQRIQFTSTFANADFIRSASYVASSLTEVHRCYSIESHTEHLNGKSYSDIFRADSPFV